MRYELLRAMEPPTVDHGHFDLIIKKKKLLEHRHGGTIIDAQVRMS